VPIVVNAPRRLRLDQALVARGLAPSRERAQAWILAGLVRIDGQVARKASDPVGESATVSVDQPEHPWVGRGGIKLAHALDAFSIACTDRLGLDIGASTGGFTDVMLTRGARHVVALDVGHNQIDWKLRQDARVTVMEGVNARYLAAGRLPESCRRVDLVSIDVSFISLRHILPVVPPLLAPDGDVVALVKPQFEAGRADVGRGGIVSDPAVHARVVDEVIALARALRLRCVHQCASPITGGDGNVEFLVHLVHEDRP
jgi:23S rRNA (cytidine1920-2'-O)/16S rRNA (cytidine1409-2'-O)-methyltransferase